MVVDYVYLVTRQTVSYIYVLINWQFLYIRHSNFRGFFRPVLHLAQKQVAALPGDDAEAAVDEEHEVLGLVVDVEAVTFTSDDVPRRAELGVEAPLDQLAQLRDVPACWVAIQLHLCAADVPPKVPPNVSPKISVLSISPNQGVYTSFSKLVSAAVSAVYSAKLLAAQKCN